MIEITLYSHPALVAFAIAMFLFVLIKTLIELIP